MRNLTLRLRLPKRLCRAVSEAQICSRGKHDEAVLQIVDTEYQECVARTVHPADSGRLEAALCAIAEQRAAV